MDDVEPIKEEKIEQLKEKDKNPEYTAQSFFNDYKALVDRTGWQIVTSPAFVSTNHGSFEVVVQTSVGKVPGKK